MRMMFGALKTLLVRLQTTLKNTFAYLLTLCDSDSLHVLAVRESDIRH